MTLQSEEIISEECRKKSNQTLSSLHPHTELKEYSLFMKKTDFTMQIPVHITPTFVSDISKFIFFCYFLIRIIELRTNPYFCHFKVSLRWRLHFDFALSKTPIQKIHKSNDAAMSLTWRPPSCLTVEVLSWDLPIVIHPFDPFVASDLIYQSTQPQSNEPNLLVLK